MQESRLWLLNHIGLAFTISTKQSHFTQLKNTFDEAVTVKRVSASSSCAWAIGHDHRVYIYVFSSDVPIRVADTTYENQRWTPIHGYSRKSMIPTDRNAWSDEHGIGDRPKESVRLPSSHWQWEGNWFIDENLRGEVVGIGGWQYALDFPSTYTPERHWNSFVRKRKWIRYRRFISTDIWARISDMEVADKAECFIDISVGGFFLPIETPGTISVWGVTNSGNVYVRTNTHHDNPEGDSWLQIGLSRDHGIINVSVGVSNLVWAITWDGHALARTNVTRSNIYGTGWESVQYPNDNTRLMQVAVGRNAVWALSREGKVWFRKGTWGDDMYGNTQSAVGTMWVEMVGEMMHITVSANDQVFAIEKDTRRILFRTGVTHSDLTGKTWESVTLQEDLSLLEKEGRMSAGIVCSCSEGDDSTCEYHRALHREISYTGSSCSSLSQMNVDETSSNVFLSPTDSYPSFSFSEENDIAQRNSQEFHTDQPQCKSAVISLTNSHKVNASSLSDSRSGDISAPNHTAVASEEVIAKSEKDINAQSSPPAETRNMKPDENTHLSLTSSKDEINKESNTHGHPISPSRAENEESGSAGQEVIDAEAKDMCPQLVPLKSPLLVEGNQQGPFQRNPSGDNDKYSPKNQNKIEMAEGSKDSVVLPEDDPKKGITSVREMHPKNKKKKGPKKHHDAEVPTFGIVFQEKKHKKKHRVKQPKSPNDENEKDKSLCEQTKVNGAGLSAKTLGIESREEEARATERECSANLILELGVECQKTQGSSIDHTLEKQGLLSSTNKFLEDTGNAKDEMQGQDQVDSVHATSSSPESKANTVKEGEDPAVTDQTDNQISDTSGKGSNYCHFHTDSLDSISVSDEIIDFVTDLMSDEEDGNDVFPPQAAAEEKDSEHSNTPQDSKDNANTSVSSSTPQYEVISLSTVTSRPSPTVPASKTFEDLPLKSESPAPFSPLSHSSSIHWEDRPQVLAFSVSQDQRSPSAGFDSSCSESGSAVVPFHTLGLAQSRLTWRWLDVTSCLIGNPASVPWLVQKSQRSNVGAKRIVKISLSLRNDILEKLKERNQLEIMPFSNIEHAIEKQTWVKNTKMHLYLYGHRNRWVNCSVELEQGISNVEESCLTLQYCHKHSQKNIQVKHDEIICVKMSSNLDDPSTFLIHSSISEVIYQPLMLRASSEAEALEWVGYLCMANACRWKVDRPISAGVAWSCTTAGDVFVSIHSTFHKKPYDLCWSQHGGHMSRIETGPSGVTWALGFNKMPYVYNGGYGGAVNLDSTGMSDNLQDLVDLDRIYVYENQKWFPVVGWCNKGVLSSDFNWLTPSGKSVASREDVKLPSSKWQWVSDWSVDFNSPGGVNAKGWQFSTNLYGHFHDHQHMRDYYRRRRWTRTCRLTTQGPWQAGGSLKLLDISVQIDPVLSNTNPIVLWAVGANGDVLCRSGVTILNPEGENWNHVATFLDKPYRSISVGGGYRVWGIASDGSAWFRSGVSPNNHSGKCWLQVVPPPPGNSLLKQVSAGASTVWAVDTGVRWPFGMRDQLNYWPYILQNCHEDGILDEEDEVYGLWRRENITPTFPEGTGWEFVSSKVRRVSVGPQDQVWIVAAADFAKFKHESGVIYKRKGITEKRPSGTDWATVIGSGWSHMTVRGISE